MLPRLLVLSRTGREGLPATSWAELDELAEVRVVTVPRAPEPDEAARLLADVDVLAATNLCLPRLDATLLEAAPRLTGIALYATGHDHLDLDLLRRYGVALSVLPDYATEAVAEHCIAQVFAMATRLHLAQDRSRGRVPADASLRGIELARRTLGVIGTGKIGRRVARLGAAVGMTVLGHDIDPVARCAGSAAGATMVGLGGLLRGSDVVAVCASAHGNPSPILGAAELHAMRPHALVANIGRPYLVDTAAMAAAVRTGRVCGYAIDDVVLDPVRDADLLDEGRVLQTGHSAWWRDEVLTRGATQWAAHIAAMLRGTPLDVVTADTAAGADTDDELAEAAQ